MAASAVSTSSRDASRRLTDAARAPVRGGLASAGFNCAAFHARLSISQYGKYGVGRPERARYGGGTTRALNRVGASRHCQFHFAIS
ncbi:hypothetical protein P3T23_003371 [Paraburkholderia sp. GAS448]